jgi:hypothetical protein
MWCSAILILSIGLVPFLGINPASAQVFDGLFSRVGLDGARFDVYGKVGYQKMGLNINFPIPQFPTTNFLMDSMDLKINRVDFIIGTLGISGNISRRIGLFAEGTASATWSGSVYTDFTGEAATFLFGGSSGWSWPTKDVKWWEINLGGKFDLYDSMAILAGFKCDRLSQKLSTPSEAAYQFFIPPVFQEDYFGDLDIRTWSPYVGVRMEDARWRFDLIWSPWLTWYDVKLPLRVVLADSGGGYSLQNAEARYELTAAGGNLLEAYGESKFTVSEFLGASLWLKGSWLQCRGNGNEQFLDTFFGTPGSPFYSATSGSDDATSTFNRYSWALGAIGRLSF